MGMTFGQLVDRARTRCLESMSAAISEAEASAQRVIAEASACLSTGEIAFAPDGLKLPLRYDLAVQGEDGTWTTKNADTVAIEFSSPAFANWEKKLQIEIRSCAWDYLCVVVSPQMAHVDWQPIRDWFLKWFDAEDGRCPDENGLYGVLHFISDPVQVSNGYEFFIDLGSATTEALEEFFDCLTGMGFTKCAIGSNPDAPTSH